MSIRKRITPRYGVSGTWEVKAPFKVVTSKEYRCIALRSFVELQIKGVDVYQNYYVPYEIEESDYEKDAHLAAVIVTLLGSDGETLHIPDTYISKFPDLSLDDFRRFIMSCDLGTLPKNTNLSHVKAKIQEEVQKIFGRAPTVNIHLAELFNQTLTDNDRKREESNRKNGIQDKTTTYGKLFEANQRLGDMEAMVRLLKRKLTEREIAAHNNDLTTRELARTREELTDKAGKLNTATKELEKLREKTRIDDVYIGKLEAEMAKAGIVLPPR